jgi:hypothetical protein
MVPSVVGAEEPVQKLVDTRLSEIGFAAERVEPDAVRTRAIVRTAGASGSR